MVGIAFLPACCSRKVACSSRVVPRTYAEKSAPLRRTVTIEEVGNTAAFLCSDLASGITGETTFVDAGSNIMAMTFDED